MEIIYILITVLSLFSIVNFFSIRSIKNELKNNLVLDDGKRILMNTPYQTSRRTKTISIDSVIDQMLDELEEEGISVLEHTIEDSMSYKEIKKYDELRRKKKITWEEYLKFTDAKQKILYFSYDDKAIMYENKMESSTDFKQKTHHIEWRIIYSYISRHANNNQEIISVKNAFKSKIKKSLAEHLMGAMDV